MVESAVECCVFLAFRLTGRGIRVRFHTQQMDVAVPEEGDVHAILKYPALVSPRHGKPLDPVEDPTSLPVVFFGAREDSRSRGKAHA